VARLGDDPPRVDTPLGEELLQTRILFFKLHQILEFVTLWYLCGSLLPLIVRLFRYSCFLDGVLEARSPTCLRGGLGNSDSLIGGFSA
jgi:hypothetical protein